MNQYDYERYSPSYDHLPQNIYYKSDKDYPRFDYTQTNSSINLTENYHPKHPATRFIFGVIKIIFAIFVLLTVALGVTS